jgi:hypothetical protein
MSTCTAVVTGSSPIRWQNSYQGVGLKPAAELQNADRLAVPVPVREAKCAATWDT